MTRYGPYVASPEATTPEIRPVARVDGQAGGQPHGGVHRGAAAAAAAGPPVPDGPVGLLHLQVDLISLLVELEARVRDRDGVAGRKDIAQAAVGRRAERAVPARAGPADAPTPAGVGGPARAHAHALVEAGVAHVQVVAAGVGAARGGAAPRAGAGALRRPPGVTPPGVRGAAPDVVDRRAGRRHAHQVPRLRPAALVVVVVLSDVAGRPALPRGVGVARAAARPRAAAAVRLRPAVAAGVRRGVPAGLAAPRRAARRRRAGRAGAEDVVLLPLRLQRFGQGRAGGAVGPPAAAVAGGVVPRLRPDVARAAGRVAVAAGRTAGGGDRRDREDDPGRGQGGQDGVLRRPALGIILRGLAAEGGIAAAAGVAVAGGLRERAGAGIARLFSPLSPLSSPQRRRA